MDGFSRLDAVQDRIKELKIMFRRSYPLGHTGSQKDGKYRWEDMIKCNTFYLEFQKEKRNTIVQKQYLKIQWLMILQN